MRVPSGKTSPMGTPRAMEKMLKPVKTSLAGSRRAPASPPRSRFEVDEVEDAFLVELVWVVELAGDDSDAVVERVDVAIDEGLVIEADFAAGGVGGVVAVGRVRAYRSSGRFGGRGCSVGRGGPCRAVTTVTSSSSSLGTSRLTVMVSVPPVSCQRSSLPPPSGSEGLGALRPPACS